MANGSFTRRRALQTFAAGAGSAIADLQLRGASENTLQLHGTPVEIGLSSVSPRTVRIQVSASDASTPPVSSDGALVQEQWGKPIARLRGQMKGRGVRCGNLFVAVTANPLAIRILDKAGRTVQELREENDGGNISFTLGDGPLLGLGQGGPQFDRRGKVDRMTSGQGGYQLRTHGAKVPVPFIVGTSGWAMFVHEPVASFDLTGERGIFKPINSRPLLPVDVFVIGANDPAAIMGEYAKITGHPEMAPLWSFGYQQSHRTLNTPEEIVQEAKTFREKKLPCDAMIYLGTDFTPVGWNTHNGEFTWNSKVFPDPKRTIDELHAEHFKVVLHIVIEGHKLTGTVKDPCTAQPLPSGRTPDGHWPPDRQVSCYWPFHKPLLDLGIDGWWPDQGDGLDAPSRLARNRMYFDGQQMYKPNERVYALHRNGFAGMQRFAAFLWSGDIQSTWETLKTHVPVAINTGISGIPYWGTDIGGFVPTQEYTGELFARWFQFAAFNPLFRSHGRDWRLHLPWGWTVGEIGYPETPSYHPDPKDLHNPAIEPICKKYLELRYQFMPYLYSAVKQTCETGLPIVRALWLHYPDDHTAVARGDQYLYGRNVLVAPVVEKGASSRSVYLPQGKWFDFWTKDVTEGGREVARTVDLETIPLYVRAGAVLPMGPVKQYTAEKVDEPMTVWVHPGADGQFSLYEDDGHTFNFRKGDFTRIDMTWTDSRRQLSMRLAKGSKMLEPGKRRMLVKVAGQNTSRETVFEGRPLVVKV